MEGIFWIIVILLALAIYFLPTIIAFYRNHHYKFIILGINVVMGMTGIGYLVAFIWAVWPSKTSLLDPVVSTPTTTAVEDGKEVYKRWGEYKRSFDSSSQPLPEVPPSLLGEQKASAPKWYYSNGGQVFGPNTADQVVSLIQQGIISKQSQVWNANHTSWQPILSSKFAPLFQNAQE